MRNTLARPKGPAVACLDALLAHDAIATRHEVAENKLRWLLVEGATAAEQDAAEAELRAAHDARTAAWLAYVAAAATFHSHARSPRITPTHASVTTEDDE